MTNFKGASKGRTSKPQTIKANAIRSVKNGDVGHRYNRSEVASGNRGFRGSTTRPQGGGPR